MSNPPEPAPKGGSQRSQNAKTRMPRIVDRRRATGNRRNVTAKRKHETARRKSETASRREPSGSTSFTATEEKLWTKTASTRLLKNSASSPS